MKDNVLIKLVEDITQKIDNGDFAGGEKLPSQQELCAFYKISRTSVHYAFNEIEKRGLIVRRPGKGVFVREKNNKRKFKDIAVLLPETQLLQVREYDNYGLEIFRGIEKRLREKNLDCRLRIIDHSEKNRLTDIISDLQPDGLVLARTFRDEEIEEIADFDLPIVLAGRVSSLTKFSGVAPNIFDYYSRFCRNLLAEGQKKIAIFVRKSLFTLNEFKMVANCINLETDYKPVKLHYYIPEIVQEKIEDENYIYDYIQELADTNNLPDVFIGATDWVAFRIVEKLQKLGIKVPAHIPVIGCLGISMPSSNFKLTTFSSDAFELGKRAVDVLCRSHENNNAPVLERVAMEYLEKDTYQAPKELEITLK